MELLNLKIQYPEQFLRTNPQVLKSSSLFLIPKFANLGIMGMTELLTALSLLGGIENKTGKNPSTIAFSEVFEQAFCFSFNNIYDCQGELFKRKLYNLTKTLDAMKVVLIKEYKRRKGEQEKKIKMNKDDFVNI